MDQAPSLTQDEASERAALLAVDRYDIAVDLRGLLDGDAARAESRIAFRCHEPGASTFLDCVAEVESVTLNGEPVEAAAGPRIRLEGLQADNVVVVQSVQTDTGTRTGIHRAVDPSDGEVYVWTSFEPDEARLVWACFDQPDLKAAFAFTVDAPRTWTVLSSSGDPVVTDVDGGRRWAFPDTPRLSTYVPALNAGPFHEVRREVDGYDLGLLCRRSLASSLDRDAEELLSLTSAGLAFFGEQFALPFPQKRYDQVFCPDMGGAMENYGCVTWSDSFIYRTPPSHGQRELRALVLLHEMAHMWFGDMVTMQWWDDLWLNEAFAEWACHWAAVEATPYTEVWASFLAGWKLGGYAADRAPSTHPIRQPMVDVATAAANFDNITYAKGAAVLRQLVALVGEDAFVTALRSYFARYAWQNATLDDLMAEIEKASGRDMQAWTATWLESAGTDTLSLRDGVLHAEGPGGAAARPHRLDLGVYVRDGDAFVRRDLLPLETTGPTLELPALPDADLLLPNDEDLTFAVVRPDEESVRTLLSAAALLPSAISRTVAVTTAWQLAVLGELPASEFVGCASAVLVRETNDAVVEPVLTLAVTAALRWAPDDRHEALMSQVADTCLQLAEAPERRQVAVRALARTAVTDEQLDALARLGADDVDLRWRRLIRLAALDRLDSAEVAALEAEDPDPEAWVRALAVRTALPDPAAKEEAWTAVLSGTTIPIGSTNEVRDAFWQPHQAQVLTPFAERYLADLGPIGAGGMIPAMVASDCLFPRVGVDAAYLDRAEAAAQDESVNPIVLRTVVERSDELRRMLVARAAGS